MNLIVEKLSSHSKLVSGTFLPFIDWDYFEKNLHMKLRVLACQMAKKICVIDSENKDHVNQKFFVNDFFDVYWCITNDNALYDAVNENIRRTIINYVYIYLFSCFQPSKNTVFKFV